MVAKPGDDDPQALRGLNDLVPEGTSISRWSMINLGIFY